MTDQLTGYMFGMGVIYDAETEADLANGDTITADPIAEVYYGIGFVTDDEREAMPLPILMADLTA